jgi:hypothetical protein
MKIIFKIIPIIILFTINNGYSQVLDKQNNELSIVFGLTQPIVTNGFNFEINYWLKDFVIDYSHGFGLEFRGNLVSEEAKKQHLNFNISNSVGIGFGYRFTKNLNLRFEPKVHIWEMYYDDQFKNNDNLIKKYTTYTLGFGAYYRWTPFENKENLLKGITISPSIRWWPNISSSLTDNKIEYQNSKTGKNEIHQANSIGVSNTALIVNVSIGYTFDLKKK